MATCQGRSGGVQHAKCDVGREREMGPREWGVEGERDGEKDREHESSRSPGEESARRRERESYPQRERGEGERERL